jgi:hypothetical protein
VPNCIKNQEEFSKRMKEKENERKKKHDDHKRLLEEMSKKPE